MYCHPCSSVHSESNDDDGEDSDNDDLFVNPNHQKPTNYVDTDSSEESNGDAEQWHFSIMGAAVIMLRKKSKINLIFFTTHQEANGTKYYSIDAQIRTTL